MKRLIATVLTAAALFTAPVAPAKADYPEQPITIVFPNKAGSGYHKIILGILSVLEDKIPTSVGVQAMPGAGTAAGARFVQSRAADGYTLMFIHEATIQASILGMLGFDMNEEFEALARVNTSAGGQYARPDAPFSNLTELQAYAKEHPGEVRASINTGALSHIDILNISEELGIELRLVHVSGGDSGSRQALLSGDVDIIKVNPVSMKAMVTDGMVKPLSYYGTSRHEFLPDIPTTEEQGFALPLTSSVHGYLT